MRSPARRASSLVLALLFAALSAPRAASGADLFDRAAPAVQVFSDKEGLPQNTVAAEAFDDDGRLWVGTQEGLAVYDGRALRRVPLPEGAKSEWITSLASLPNDVIAAGTHTGGLWIVDGDRFTLVDAKSGLPDDAVESVAASADGSELWVGTRHGLARRSHGAWSTVASSEVPFLSGPVSSVVVGADADGALVVWAGTPAGVASFTGGVWRGYARGERGLPAANVMYVSLAADDAGIVRPWVSMRGGGLATLDGDSWRTIPGLPCADVGPVVRAQGALYVATVCGGIARVTPQGVTLIDTKTSALPSDLVRSLLVGRDAQGPSALWAGTETGGMARVSLGEWRGITAKNSPLHAAVYAFGWSRDERGVEVTWIGTEAGLARFDDRGWSDVTIPGLTADEQYVNAVVDARVASARGVWVGTFGGAARWKDGAWRAYRKADGLPSDIVLTLREVTGPDGEPELVAGMRNGLARFDGTQWAPMTEPGAPSDEEVTSITETSGAGPRPILWVATAAGGVYRREGGAWTHLDAKSSALPCDEVLQVARVTLPGARERLFVSTGEAGLAWIDPKLATPKWSFLTTKTTPALPDQVVYGVQEDARGRIYAFTNHGVARLTPRDAATDDFDVYVLTTDDGLPSNESNSGASAIDPEGRVWAGTTAGAAVLDGAMERDDRTPKRLLLEGVRLFGDAFNLRAHPELSHAQDTLSFELSLVSLHRPAETRYRTQLVGLEPEPSSWTPDAKVRFTSLPAGSYELRAWGRDDAGNVTGPLAIPFRVKPAPWKTWSAWAAYVAAAASLVTFGMRARVASLKRRAEELTNRVAERTAELATRNAELARKNAELDKKNGELVASHERADRIFSAFTDVLPGSVLDDKYRIETRIGAGGFATVFRAWQIALDRPVAVKIFRPSPGNDSALALERFRREGMSASRVQHPNAIQVFDAGISSDGIPYIVMELLEGHTLSEEIRAPAGLPLRRALDLAIPICEALAAAHEVGLVHRDVKPDNVFLHESSDGEVVKLLDFGIAKILQVDDDGASANTGSATFVGTPKYMAPERLSYSAYGEKSDVYSVGVIVYEAIAGQVPWGQANDLFALVAQIIAGRVVPMSEYGVPASLSDVIARALSHDPGARASAAEMARELATLRDSLPDAQLDRVYGRAREAQGETGVTMEVERDAGNSGIRVGTREAKVGGA